MQTFSRPYKLIPFLFQNCDFSPSFWGTKRGKVPCTNYSSFPGFASRFQPRRISTPLPPSSDFLFFINFCQRRRRGSVKVKGETHAAASL